DPSSKTHVLLISGREKPRYIKYYATPLERLHDLPPGISDDRLITENIENIRKSVRSGIGVGDEEILLLMVGSGFETKGLDRSLGAVSGLPDRLRKKTKLVVIGRGKTKPFEHMARRLRIFERLIFLGGRDDVPRFMVSADLLLHPARSENTGTVLIEAMAAGLPVLATDVCGYAFYVSAARAGLLIPSPFEQRSFNELLRQMLESPEREAWKHNGMTYVSRNDFFSMPEKAADVIESLAKKANPR
ncbi:MAG: glycosyltransferase, partial [Nitrospirota bacterium]